VFLGSFVVSLELLAVATPGAPSTAPRGNSQQVDRTLKSDRIPLIQDAIGAGLRARPVRPALPVECIDAGEANRKHIYTTEVAGRCVV
jgi:hypothetical protein